MKNSLLIILIFSFTLTGFSQDPDGWLMKAREYKRTGQLDSAVEYFNKTGAYFRARGVFDESYAAFMEGYAINDSIQSPGLSKSLLFLGSVEGMRDQPALAAEFFKRAINIASKLQDHEDSLRYAQGHSSLGIELIRLSDFDSAEYVLNEAYRMGRLIPMLPSWFGTVNTNLGLLEETRGNHSASHNYYQRALQIFKKDSIINKMALAYQNLGVSSMQLGMLDSSLFYMHQSRKISKANAYNDRLRNVYGNLVVFYKNYIPNADSALKYSELEFRAMEEVLNAESANEINYLREVYDYQKVQKMNAEQAAQIERVSGERKLLIIIVLVLILIAVIIYAVGKRKQIVRDREFTRINSLLKDQEIAAFHSVMDAQEAERKRIATELHDRLGSTLSAAKLYFNHVEDLESAGTPVISNDFTKAMELLDTAVQDVRSISHSMASGVLTQFGLVPALMDLRETISGTGKIKMKVIAHGLDERLSQQTELQLYRIIQELVSNALKHSKATEIIVQLTQHSEELNVTVEDNGIGFDTNQTREGIGLKNIYSRADMLNAHLNIDSGKGRGTLISIDIPT
jgi:signal transduction histidine kinase